MIKELPKENLAFRKQERCRKPRAGLPKQEENNLCNTLQSAALQQMG